MEQQESCTPHEIETEIESMDVHTDVGIDNHIEINTMKPKRYGFEVWTHFTIIYVPNGKPTKCTCKLLW